MTGASLTRRFLFFSGLLLMLVLTACSESRSPASAPASSIVEVTRVVEKTVLVTQVVEVEKVVTATAEPTVVPFSSQTEEAAIPATGVALPDDGFGGWCVPKDVLYSPEGVEQAGAMPEGSYPVEVVNGEKQVVIEVQNCSFVYTFGTSVPAGTQLKMYDNSNSPFLTLDLTPTAQFPNKGFVTVTHPYVIDPPFWNILYRLDLVSLDGKVLRSDTINFKRGWIPRTCWDGTWPDPVTLICKVKGEAHPWDPWYGSEYPYQPTAAIGD